MAAIGLTKDASKIIPFKDFLFGTLKFIPRLPAIAKVKKEIQKIMANPDLPLSVGTFLEENAVKYPDSPAILFEDVSYTHSEFNAGVNRYAHYLLSLGVKKGDTIVALLESRPEFLFLIGAVSKIGAVVSLINSNLRGSVLSYSLGLIPSKHFIVGEELIEAFEDVKEDLNPGNDATFYFLKDTGAGKIPEGYIDWCRVTSDAESENPSTTSEITITNPFVYMFTSGTTGMPKAAVTQHSRWVRQAMLFGNVMLRLTPKDTIYIPTPFYHGMAVYAGWSAAAAGGAAMAIRRKFSVSNFWKDVDKFNVTAFVYIGELCRYLMQLPQSPDDSKNTVKKMLGAGLRPEMWKAFKSRFAIKEIYEFYGSSESNLGFFNLLNLDCTVGTCPMSFAIIKYDVENEKPIKDKNGFFQKVEAGEAGLLLAEITDDMPLVGYTDDEATEKKILRNVLEKGDSWFDTGDLLRDIGFNHAQFVDRLGDTFRWKGENVATVQVEGVIDAYDQVLESNVYGVIIPGTDGRAGMAAIITDRASDDFDLAGLLSALKADLPSYAVPSFLIFKTEFETTASMKLKKIKLKEEAFDPNQVSDPLYVLLPGSNAYAPLTEDIYSNIMNGSYKF